MFRGGSRAMTTWLKETIAEDYPAAKKARWSDPALPEIKSLDLALNVASCDYTPVIVAVSRSPERLASLRKELLNVAWDPKLAGQFAFASSVGGSEVKAVLDLEAREGLFVLQPDAYGLSARILYEFDDAKTAAERLMDIVKDYAPEPKNHGTHVRMGVALGMKWNTEIPVTDMQFVRATERLWGEKYVHQPPKRASDSKSSTVSDDERK